MKKLIGIIAGIPLLAAPGLRLAVEASGPSVSTLIMKAGETKGQKERDRLLKKISAFKPNSQEDVTVLLEAMTDSSLSVACRQALSRVTPEDNHLSLPFVKALKSRDPAVRSLSVRKVGTLKAKEAVPELRRIAKKTPSGLILTREDGILIGDALYSLGEIADKDSIPLMLSWLKKFGPNGGVAGLALLMVGKGAVSPIISCALQTKDKKKAKICTHLIRGLKGRESAPALLKLARDRQYSREIRGNAIEALGYIGDSDSLEELKEVFESSEEFIWKVFIFSAFSQAKYAGGMSLALEALKDANPLIRTSAIRLLGEIGDESSVPVLQAARDDVDRAVRHRAALALKKLTGKDYDWKKPKDAR